MLVPHMFILRKRSIKKKRYQGVFDIAFPFLVFCKYLLVNVLKVIQACVTQVCVTQTCVIAILLLYLQS